MPEPHSKAWQQDIVRLIKHIDTLISQTFPEYADLCVLNNENVREAFLFYQNDILPSIKDKMGMAKGNIDRHKIVAGYILAFLKYPPFLIHTHSEMPLFLNIANEYFLYHFMDQTLCADWESHRSQKISIHVPDNILRSISGKDEDSSDYRDHFHRLMFFLRNNIEEFCVFSLSHLIFYIEMTSVSLFYGMRGKYFSVGKIETMLKYS